MICFRKHPEPLGTLRKHFKKHLGNTVETLWKHIGNTLQTRVRDSLLPGWESERRFQGGKAIEYATKTYRFPARLKLRKQLFPV